LRIDSEIESLAANWFERGNGATGPRGASTRLVAAGRDRLGPSDDASLLEGATNIPYHESYSLSEFLA
jgi:hypothetical protein